MKSVFLITGVGALVIVVDCDDVPPNDRFAFWAETNRKSFYHTDVTRPRDDIAPFSGRAEGWQIADAVFGRQITDTYRASRTARMIAERETGMVVLGCPRIQPIETTFEQYPSVITQPDDILVFDGDIEWAATAESNIEYQAITIPRTRLHPFLGSAGKVRPRLVAPAQELYGMLLACTREFVKMRDCSSAAAEGALQVLVHLLAVTCGIHPGDHESIRHSLSEARLYQAAQFIHANMHNPGLNAELIAAHLGISARRLHALYEPTGNSVARQILAARLARSRELLALDPQKTILEVALSCGFYSHSTFYRCFASLFGVTPGEFRKLLVQDGGASTIEG